MRERDARLHAKQTRAPAAAARTVRTRRGTASRRAGLLRRVEVEAARSTSHVRAPNAVSTRRALLHEATAPRCC